jgi:arginine-tRNA-protein transferase
MTTQNIPLYLTSEHECGYFKNRMATSLVPDPSLQMSKEIYSRLIALGYRRSGDFTYRPHCKDCAACRPCRIRVKDFVPSRSQRRCLQRNQDLETRLVPAQFTDEYFALYCKYINARHAEGNMVNPTPDDFSSFLYSDWSQTFFIEVRQQQRLLAVAVTDPVADGLSAVYSFFDPDERARGLGNFCILSQIQETAARHMDYLYMGYWIRDCRKMQYKTNYRPMELFDDQDWQVLGEN